MSDKTALDKLREPFEASKIGKLPKPTKQQTDEVRADFKKGIRCNICGGWHHKSVVHLDYVGHAALTDRFLTADINWNWEPLSIDSNGLPLIVDGLLWIKLTVGGVTRLGVGDAGMKKGGDAVKECIGDALRNAGMRFGAALDLWHKGDLHDDGGQEEAKQEAVKTEKPVVNKLIVKQLNDAQSMQELIDVWETIENKPLYFKAKGAAKAKLLEAMP